MARKRLDVVLVNPGDRLEIYQQLGATLAAIESPVWVGLIASYAREKGLSVEIIDANAEGLTPEQTAERVIDLDPLLTSVIVYGHNPSASTQVMPSASAICSVLKRRDPARKVVLVGGHVAALPERTLREEATDFVAGGEDPTSGKTGENQNREGGAQFHAVLLRLIFTQEGDFSK